uniref:Uncharacterized protein n=1 Tax=Panagrellus redivivus TaxID=6233 RepID=A0A7E4V7L8_PANRE
MTVTSARVEDRRIGLRVEPRKLSIEEKKCKVIFDDEHDKKFFPSSLHPRTARFATFLALTVGVGLDEAMGVTPRKVCPSRHNLWHRL